MKIPNFVKEMFEWIKKVFNFVFGVIWKVILFSFNQCKKTIGIILKWIGKVFGFVSKVIWKIILFSFNLCKRVVNTILKWIGKIFNFIFKVIEKIISFSFNLIKKIIMGVVDQMKKIFGKISDNKRIFVFILVIIILSSASFLLIKINSWIALGYGLFIIGLFLTKWKDCVHQVPENERWVTEIFKKPFGFLKSGLTFTIPFLEKIPEANKVPLKAEMHDWEAKDVVTNLEDGGYKIHINYAVQVRVLEENEEAIYDYIYKYKDLHELMETVHIICDTNLRTYFSKKTVEESTKADKDDETKILEQIQAANVGEIFKFENFEVIEVIPPKEYLDGVQIIKKADWDAKASKHEIKKQQNLGKSTRRRIDQIVQARGVEEVDGKKIYLELEQLETLKKMSGAKIIMGAGEGEIPRIIKGFSAASSESEPKSKGKDDEK